MTGDDAEDGDGDDEGDGDGDGDMAGSIFRAVDAEMLRVVFFCKEFATQIWICSMIRGC